MESRLETLTNILESRGFAFTSPDAYGPMKDMYDYGPADALLKRNIVDSWWQRNVSNRLDVYPFHQKND